jgi:hypothetical protein
VCKVAVRQNVGYNRGIIHMKKVNLYFSEQDVAAIKKLAEETGLSFSEHVRRAVTLYLESLRTDTRYVVREKPTAEYSYVPTSE